MFQSFKDIADPSHGDLRVAKLRERLLMEQLAGYLVPRADEYQGEYVPPSAERLFWLTGFSGSAGLAAVLTDQAALFVDGRYTVQARAQVDVETFEILQVPEEKLADWLGGKLNAGGQVGYDPHLHTIAEIESLEEVFNQGDTILVATEHNIVDEIWDDRPAPPLASIAIHGLEFSGQAAEEKIAAIQSELRECCEDATVLTLTDSVAWTFNIRGGDLAHTPVALAHAIIHVEKKPELFIDDRKTDDQTRGYLEAFAALKSPQDLAEGLTQLGRSGACVRLDPQRTAIWFASLLRDAGATIKMGQDPCLLPKARKNNTELKGARAAHVRDGAAVTRFLAWLDRAVGGRTIDEITAARELESCRGRTGQLMDISFDTISGSGSNGAIVHYRVTEATNRTLHTGELYLVDSGGQYKDGTTDITRTVAIGEPSTLMRRCFTLVLKGHIAIATARFPIGTRGCDLDPLARQALWQAGYDFDHGTGHGVGSYLSVHEGPASISRRGLAALETGMILSNEPGYYKEGEFGIRLENLVIVSEPTDVSGGDRAMMAFETITLVPFDRRLVDTELLSDAELDWLNAYHRRVAEVIGPELQGDDAAWLTAAIAPITRATS